MKPLSDNDGRAQERHAGVDVHIADSQDLQSFSTAKRELDALRVPILLSKDSTHERLYIAALDGTGNSMFNDEPGNWSVVAKIHEEIERTKPHNIASGYVEGTFTQEGALRTPERLADGALGHSFDERVETAYLQLCTQAKAWLREDPEAQIRVVGVGFSRGSEQAAALLRLIDERGIRDPDGAQIKLDQDNIIQTVRYDSSRPLLVPPGKTLQAALLVDPVSTGVRDEDRRLPGAALSTFEISAEHERRDQYKDNDHIPPGFSEGMRNLNVRTAGAHSDAGDTYARNGLGTLNFNLCISFLNRLSDRAFLQERPLPRDPDDFVIHRSDQHLFGLYTTRGYDRDGQRDRLEDQHPAPGIQRKDPIRPELDAQVERRTAPRTAPAMSKDDTVGSLFERLSTGALQGDDRAMSSAVGDYLRSAPGLQFQADASHLRQSMDAQARQAALDAQLWSQQQETARAPHAMRM